MPFTTEVFPSNVFVAQAAARIADAIDEQAPVVLTGGTTVGAVYSALSELADDWSGIDVLFSDERCVPPDDDRSNFKLADQALLSKVAGAVVHRVHGED